MIGEEQLRNVVAKQRMLEESREAGLESAHNENALAAFAGRRGRRPLPS